MHKDPELSDASNLALTWLKLGKATEARALLEKHLVENDPTAQVAAAHFNLGLIEQQLGNLGEACATTNAPTRSNRRQRGATRSTRS